MIQFSIYQVFSDLKFGDRGNTAAVVLLNEPIPAEKMQSLAADLNQPATSFLWKESGHWHVRWFAPDEEIGLCGHGAFASFAFLKDEEMMDPFLSMKYSDGAIEGWRNSSGITIGLQTIVRMKKIDPPEPILKGLGIPIIEMYETSNKHLILTDTESSITAMKPDFNVLRASDIFGYAVTAPGDQTDFVSRTLVPHVGQLEDHATGSSHAILTPYWAEKLNKNRMVARQLSLRGGYFRCELNGDLVKLGGGHEKIASGQLNLVN